MYEATAPTLYPIPAPSKEDARHSPVHITDSSMTAGSHDLTLERLEHDIEPDVGVGVHVVGVRFDLDAE